MNKMIAEILKQLFITYKAEKDIDLQKQYIKNGTSKRIDGGTKNKE